MNSFRNPNPDTSLFPCKHVLLTCTTHLVLGFSRTSSTRLLFFLSDLAAQWQAGKGRGSPLPLAALTAAVVISGTGDKHYFPSNSLIMSVLPHGWLSKAKPEPHTPAEGLCVQGRYTVRAWVCACVQRGKSKSYTLALSEYNPLSQLLSTRAPCSYLFFYFKAPFIDFTGAFKKSELGDTMTGCRRLIL